MNAAPRLSLLGWRGLAFVVIGATLALWPALVAGGRPFTMVDSFIYLDQGEAIWRHAAGILRDLLPASPATGDAAGLPAYPGPPAGEAIGSVRSLPYAAALGLLLPLGPLAMVWVQAALVLVPAWAVVQVYAQDAPRGALLAVAAATLVGSSLPFMASFLMPDVLAAAIVLFALLIVHGIDRFGRAAQAGLAAIALFATAVHYGNIPFAAAVLTAAVIARAALGGRIGRALVLTAGACLLAVGVNVVLGRLAFDETSLTPRRFPILLARSIEDGPARWHLQDACPDRGYAVCDWWDGDIPDNVGSALWGDRGLENAPPAMQARFRDEELTILFAAFREYPLAQLRSLGGNAVHQAVRVGTEFAMIETVQISPEGRRVGAEAAFQPLYPLRGIFSAVQKAVFYAALLALAWAAATAPKGSPLRPAIAVLAVAIAVNAAIFGGLSAPNDRYGARVAWMAVLVAGLALARRKGRTPRAVPQPAPCR